MQKRKCCQCRYAGADSTLWTKGTRLAWPATLPCVNHPDAPGRIKQMMPSDSCRNFAPRPGKPESTNPSQTCSMPRIEAASAISARRSRAMSARFSGVSRREFRIVPRSPPVHVATITRTPSATYLAVVAAPLEDSSSGWAWTWSSRSASDPCMAGIVARQPRREAAPPTRMDAMTTDAAERLARRYPRPRTPRWLWVVVAVTAAAIGAVWLVWVAVVGANPPVSARIASFQVTSDTDMQVVVTIER